MLQMIAQALATHPLARARFVATVARFQIPRLIAFHGPLLKFDLGVFQNAFFHLQRSVNLLSIA